MRNSEKIYSYFLKALQDSVRIKGRGAQKILALETGKTEGYISQVINPKTKKKVSFETQVALAKACGYEYEDFLALGRRLLEGKPPKPEQPPPLEPTCRYRRISDQTGKEDTREGILDLFQNKEKAREAVLLLAGIERADKEHYADVIGYIRGTANSLDIKKTA